MSGLDLNSGALPCTEPQAQGWLVAGVTMESGATMESGVTVESGVTMESALLEIQNTSHGAAFQCSGSHIKESGDTHFNNVFDLTQYPKDHLARKRCSVSV